MKAYEVTILNWDRYNEKRKDVKHCSWLRLEADYPQSQSLYGLTAAERYVHTSLICLAMKKGTGRFRIDADWFCHWAGGCFDGSTLRSALAKLASKDEPAVTYEPCPARERNEVETTTVRYERTDERNGPNGRDVLPPPGSAGEVTGSAVWSAYAESYEPRHGAAPIRNAKTNSLCKQLVGRLGKDAPEVTRFYLTHHDRFYVQSKHPLGLLVRDAEKLHTEWKTGRKGTASTAKETEVHEGNVEAIREHLKRKEAKAGL